VLITARCCPPTCMQSERACTPELYDLLAHMDRIGTTAAANHSLDSGIRGPALGQTWEGPTRPVLPRALLLRLQLAMATKDYTAALDALHRYCDHVQVGRATVQESNACHIFKSDISTGAEHGLAASLQYCHSLPQVSWICMRAYQCVAALIELQHHLFVPGRVLQC
jgi:hypothetical protein